MSIIYESDNSIFISHEQYVNKIYSEIVPGLKINQHIFLINQPFKKQGTKRKLAQETKFDGIRKDLQIVQDKYVIFYKKLILETYLLQNNLDNNNIALETVKQLYEKINTNEISNTNGENENMHPIIVKIKNKEYLFPKCSKFYCMDVCRLSEKLMNQTFDLILIDPPWWNKAIRRKCAKTKDGYSMMDNSKLGEMPIKKLLSDEGLVVVWCTNSPQNLNDLLNHVFPLWGIHLVCKWYWLKITWSGKPVINFSEPPAKLPFEQILIAQKLGTCTDTLQKTDGKLIVSIPSALHSHKPPLVEILKPLIKSNGDYLEIFARYLLPGWTSWGLEVLHFQNKDLYGTCD